LRQKVKKKLLRGGTGTEDRKDRLVGDGALLKERSDFMKQRGDAISREQRIVPEVIRRKTIKNYLEPFGGDETPTGGHLTKLVGSQGIPKGSGNPRCKGATTLVAGSHYSG